MSKTIEQIYFEAKAKATKSSSSKSIEEIFKKARNNKENFPQSESPLKSPIAEETKPKWYEKTWLIALLILFVFPIGLIWLWSVGRYSRNVKIGVTVIVAFLVFIGQTNDKPADESFPKSSNTYVVGYLRQGTTWIDDNGRSHINSSRVKVEVTGNTVVMANGNRRMQIYFLEGSNAGSWGYVNSSSLSR